MPESTQDGLLGSFVIDGLPRTGSTSFARLLNCHPEVRCLIEPFHPSRYQGQFHHLALEQDMAQALAMIHQRWNGLKHVWEPTSGWPFRSRPALNDDLILGGGSILFMRRRNYLRRYVSGAISQRLGFWVGTRKEFLWRLERTSLVLERPEVIRERLDREIAAVDQRLLLLATAGIRFREIFYEDFFFAAEQAQFAELNETLAFLGASPLTQTLFETQARKYLSAADYQWASDELYRRIPGIAAVEREVGSSERGFLFNETERAWTAPPRE